MLDASYEGQNISEEYVNNYGIHHALIGSKNRYHVNNPSNVDKNLVSSEEYVFENKYQIIPICSFIVKRTDFFVFWVDEKGEYQKNLNELKKKVEENVYYFSKESEVVEFVEKKKRNKKKLILSFCHVKYGEKILGKIRKIIGSNVVCLVFSEYPTHEGQTELVKHENVLFTDKMKYLKQFANIDLLQNEIIKFIKPLEF